MSGGILNNWIYPVYGKQYANIENQVIGGSHMKTSASVPICAVLVATFSIISCLAVAQEPPGFQNLRFEEDWSGYPADGGDALWD